MDNTIPAAKSPSGSPQSPAPQSEGKRQRGRPAVAEADKKKSTSFYLSPDTRHDLRDLAAAMRLSQASVIELLVGEAMRKRGIKRNG